MSFGVIFMAILIYIIADSIQTNRRVDAMMKEWRKRYDLSEDDS